MAPTVNQTGEVIATGNWQKIAQAGDCIIECNKPFQDAIMADQVTVPECGHWHAGYDRSRNDNLSSWAVPAGSCVWAKSEAGATFVITATDPVV